MPFGNQGFSFPFTKPLGYVQFTGVTGVIQLGVTAPATGATAIPQRATYCVLCPENAAIRWRDDGDPSASVGMPVGQLATFAYQGDMSKLKMIPQSGTAIINLAYFA